LAWFTSWFENNINKTLQDILKIPLSIIINKSRKKDKEKIKRFYMRGLCTIWRASNERSKNRDTTDWSKPKNLRNDGETVTWDKLYVDRTREANTEHLLPKNLRDKWRGELAKREEIVEYTFDISPLEEPLPNDCLGVTPSEAVSLYHEVALGYLGNRYIPSFQEFMNQTQNGLAWTIPAIEEIKDVDKYHNNLYLYYSDVLLSDATGFALFTVCSTFYVIYDYYSN